MPMPKPKENEAKDDYIKRFMSDPLMVKEYPDAAQRRAVAEKEWEKKEAVEMSEKFTIKNVPIAAAGKWACLQGVIEITEKDLEDTVQTYQETKDRFAPFIRLGSHSSQKKMRESDVGLPSFGVLTNVRKVGSQLVADLSDLSKKVHELIANGAYRRPSIELWKDWRDTVTGSVRKRFLRGIALLGSEHPASNTLPLKIESVDDVAALYASGGEDAEKIFIVSVGPFEFKEELEKPTDDDPPKDKGGDNDMDDKLKEQYEANLKNAQGKLEAAEKANVDTVDEYKSKVEELEAKIKGMEDAEIEAAAKAKDATIETFLEEQTKAGKLLPAQKDIYADRLLGADDLTVEMTTMKSMFEELPKLMDIGTEHGDGEGEGDNENKELKADRAKEDVKVEMAELGLIGKADEKELDEYAEAVATRKPGEVHLGMEQSRDRLAKELDPKRAE